jgi:arginine:ornithine antiporter/lysine permease
VTVFKIVPILVFIVVMFFYFDAGVFADNWTAYGYGDLGSLNEQVRNTMLITTFVFIGIEGASVYSRYAKRRADVGKATVLGFLSVLSIFSLVTLSSYSVVPQPELAATRQPSMVGVFQSQVGDWGEVFISVAVIVSVLGAYLAWTLMAAEVMYIPARAEDFPEFLGQENEAGTPITSLVVTSLAVQGLLALTLFVSDALNFMLDLATSLALLPYLLAAAYALKLGLTGESYDGVSKGVRRKETVVAGVAVAYTLLLFEAAGMKFVLLMTVLLAPATLLYVKARSEQGRRIFSPAEIGLFVLIVVGGVIGAVGLGTGGISL